MYNGEPAQVFCCPFYVFGMIIIICKLQPPTLLLPRPSSDVTICIESGKIAQTKLYGTHLTLCSSTTSVKHALNVVGHVCTYKAATSVRDGETACATQISCQSNQQRVWIHLACVSQQLCAITQQRSPLSLAGASGCHIYWHCCWHKLGWYFQGRMPAP